MNARTSARIAVHTPASRPDARLTTDCVRPVAAALASQMRATSAANDAAQAADDEHRVNPLWMITVGLGFFFALLVLLTTSG
ncbi:MAG: hypothetical protein ACREV5_17360 [Steroidobacter sp.]